MPLAQDTIVTLVNIDWKVVSEIILGLASIIVGAFIFWLIFRND